MNGDVKTAEPHRSRILHATWVAGLVCVVIGTGQMTAASARAHAPASVWRLHFGATDTPQLYASSRGLLLREGEQVRLLCPQALDAFATEALPVPIV